MIYDCVLELWLSVTGWSCVFHPLHFGRCR